MKLWIISILLLMGRPSIAKPRMDIRISATLIAKSERDEILVTYEHPCGSKFKGFLLRPSENAVEVGVLLRAARYSCTGLSQFKVKRIPELRYGSFKKIYSIRLMKLRGKPKLRPLEALQMVKESGGAYKLQGIYQSQCGLPLGFVIAQGKGFRVSFLEQQMVQNSSNCKPNQELAELGGLHFQNEKNIKIKSGQKRPFDIYSTSVKISSSKKTGLLKLRYKRRCNEAPIGPLFQSSRAGHLKVGMLVARYHKRPCSQTSAKVYWTLYRSRFVQIPPKIRIHPMREMPSSKRVRLSAPYHLSNPKKGVPLTTHTLVGCNKIVGITMMERRGQIYISSVLENHSTGITRCLHPLKAVPYALREVGIKGHPAIGPLHFRL